VFCAAFIGMYVLYFHTKFKKASFSGYVFTAMKLKPKYRFLGGASIVLFYIFPCTTTTTTSTKKTLNITCVFFSDCY
jgi:hypothetical protein